MRLILGVAAIALLFVPGERHRVLAQASAAPVVYRVAPHDTDPAITRFDTPNYVLFRPPVDPAANLFVFMSGTGSAPEGMTDFLNVVSLQGYRVISLAYNDTPAVVGICPRDPDPSCSAAFREKRIFGDGVMNKIDDRPGESIVNRLDKLIVTLNQQHPTEGWGQYLDGDAPNWSRIVVSGHSQGAGMAAYLAQRKLVARVVLFSSPWDFSPGERLAPWINGPGVTPSDRWFATYHQKEKTAALIARAYQLLRIPPDHIRVLTRQPKQMVGDNPYHLSMVGNRTTPRDRTGGPAYAADWAFLVGPR